MMGRSQRRSTLHLVAGLLILSAFFRVFIGATEAMANNATQTPDIAIDPEPAKPDGSLLAALQSREDRIAAREAQLADRIQALQVAEDEIGQKLSALQAAEESLKATIALADSASETDLLRLATVYENMAPKDAAALFEQMPPPFAAGFLGMMDPTAAAKIMAGLTPETAYSFSVVLAGRNANVPKQ